MFQKARAELSARAAETPVLSEVRALQRSVKQLLLDIESASDRASSQLEIRCVQARELAADLDRRFDRQIEMQAARTSPFAETEIATATEMAPAPKRTRRTKAKPAPPVERMERETRLSAEPPRPALAVVAQSGPQNPSVRPLETRRQTVYALADAGEPPAAIARQTGISEGEIETLLGLRSRQTGMRREG